MRKDRLYFLTFVSIAIIYTIIASIALHYINKSETITLLETYLEFSKNETKTFASLVGHQMDTGIGKEAVIQNVQESLEETDLDIGYLSILDWSGKIVCHPDIMKVGEQAGASKSFVSSITEDLTIESFYTQLKTRLKEFDSASNDSDGIDNQSEVIHLYSVAGTDWIVAAHIGLGKISLKLKEMRSRFLTIFFIMGLLVVLSYAAAVRLIGSVYEKRLELKNKLLEDEVFNLSKLNSAVGDYQQRVHDTGMVGLEDTPSKRRVLTYLRNELLSIPIEEIAHIYTENTITYVVSFDGKRSTTNSSLEELFSQLDSAHFFRANRQFIIAISSIDKIVKYGNNQLKILVTPNPDSNIIISKNRAAEFKQWLNL
ncbi:LytR/AlgR family response regulator transcription factor [Flagellimonas sp.]|uniref:LytR/AlgR family response regulator transcription factor n=1 Tax=Flagellimonas sp. TaxID=2058762 RepID=UPI003B5A8F03